MPDLKQFGKALRAIRESRNITQEEAVELSKTYSEGSGLRKIERGEQRPRRKVIIDLMTLGLDEKNPATINELLVLAGFGILSDTECTRLGLPLLPLPPPPVCPEPPPNPVPISPADRTVWNLIMAGSLTLAAVLFWPQDWVNRVAALLYAGLFVISVLLEAAHGFQGEATVRGALLAGSISFAAALFGSWTNTGTRLLRDASGALGLALLMFTATAVWQWFLVRPVLTEDSIARTEFQPHTPQGAHLKNTLYFLFTGVGLWLLPHYCLRAEAALSNSRKPSGLAVMPLDGVCLRPLWLWVILLILLAISVPMGSRLLDNLRPSPHKNLYISLFYARAFLYFSFGAVCILSYSRAYSELISKFVMNSSP